MYARLINPSTGEKTDVQIGWSWSLFLFWQYGIPLFNRNLSILGRVGLAALFIGILNSVIAGWVEHPFFSSNFFATYVIQSLDFLVIGIYFGCKGNELQAKQLLENGWVFSDEGALAAQYARQQWGLAA